MAAKTGVAFVVLALAVLLLPLRWLGAMILAAAIHECSHWAAVRLCGGQVHRLSLGLLGAEMAATGLNGWQELLCALAGPVGALLTLSLRRILPRTAICATLQSLYNLLPLYPLDGGRAVQCLCRMLFPPPMGEKICDGFQMFFRICIGIMGIYGTFFLKLGLLPMVMAAFLLVKAKIPCKSGHFSLQ